MGLTTTWAKKRGDTVKFSRVVAVGIGSAALVVASSGSALAGEVTGNGDPTQAPAHTNSICAFSGLNDNPTEPGHGGRVQSYGQIVAAGGKAFVPSPGVGCNGHTGFLSGAGH